VSPSIDLPYNRSRRYLTGMDWLVHSLHLATRRATGVGSLCQLVLHVEGELPEAELRRGLQELEDELPVLRGRPARDLTLAPYWRVSRPPRGGRGVSLDSTRSNRGSGDGEIPRALEDFVNRPFSSDREHVAFHIMANDDGTSYLGMTFDHRLFDARGSEMFLGLLQRKLDGERDVVRPGHVRPTEPAHLDGWAAKFEAGRHVNRSGIALADLDMAEIPLPPRSPGRPYRFLVAPFDEHQAEHITVTAHRAAGCPLLMPFGLAAAARALDAVFPACGATGGDYLVPVTLDAREGPGSGEDLFFNHLSFLLFTAPGRDFGDPNALVRAIGRQMFEQVKSRYAQNVSEACMLLRILPLRLVEAFRRPLFRGKTGSFCFSSLGEAAFTSPSFMGRRVLNLFHMPRVAPPPGIGLFLNQFRGRINATLSYLEGTLDDARAAEAFETFKGILLSDAPREPAGSVPDREGARRGHAL